MAEESTQYIISHQVGADINETRLYEEYPDVMETLLKDHTTRKPIFWATDSYAEDEDGKKKEGYQFCDPITIEKIIGDENGQVIRPRALKTPEEQAQRTKDKAEVFTPSWVCNAQNNLIDDAWFGRKDVFNHEFVDEEGNHTWAETVEPIVFTDEKGKTWKDYVRDTRMEITCGEAPYLVSRYDTVTGQTIPLAHRIGLLDRKLRVVSENTDNTKDWLKMAQDAYKNTYGYEWQGDSLLLAREALLITFIEYYEAKFGHRPKESSINNIAYIVSWNLWQMDGLKHVVPCSCDHKYKADLFGNMKLEVCDACKKGKQTGHIGIKCVIRDWRKGKPKDWKPKEGEKAKDRPWQKVVFSSLLHAPSTESE